jgi:hypothetical protein
MAGAFPAAHLRWGYAHSLQIRIARTQFRSGREQRHAVSGLLNSFSLQFTNVPWTVLTALRDFHTTQKGSFDSTWTIDLEDPWTGSVRTYAGMAFQSDLFEYVEGSIGRYSLTLEATQTVAEAVSVVPQATYPAINGGVRVQLPFGSSVEFRTERNDMPDGKRISRYVWASPIRKWRLEYPVITDDEVEAIVDHYLANGGPVHPYTFTDPNTATAYANCRFSEAPIQIVRVCPNVNRLTTGIEQFAA